MNRRRLHSVIVRLACSIIAIVLLWPLTPWEAGPRLVVETSPFLAICASIANRSIGLTAGVGIVFAVLSMLRKRLFCRFVCPTGLLLDGVSHIGLRKTSWWSKCPPLGQYASAITVAGALIGYPVLLWMDPMAIFAGPFAMPGASDLMSGLLAGSVLGCVLLVTLLMGSVWCGRICPLGGLQDQLAALKWSVVRRSQSLLERISSPPRRRKRFAMARRVLLASTMGAAFGLWGRRSGLARAQTAPLRPPGALVEEQFAGVCIRCGNCTAACPTKIIRPDAGEAGLAGLLAPMIHYSDRDYCLEDCNLCTQVCPSGALQALDLEQKNRYIIGEALVDTSLCLLTLGKRECDLCLIACPFDAVEIVWDNDLYVAYPSVDPNKCNGCGACEAACPTEQLKAISVWTLLQEVMPDGTIIDAPRFLDAS